MHIWVIGRGFPTKTNRMLGSFEFEQAQMLARRGHEVIYPVVGMSLRRWNNFGRFDRLIDSVRVIECQIPIGWPFLTRAMVRQLSSQLKKRLYRKIMQKYGVPDVVHVHYPALHPFVEFAELQERGVKLVCTEHFTKVQNKTLEKQDLRNLRECVQYFDHILCVGEPLKQSIIELTGTTKQITVVPNIVPEIFNFEESNISDREGSFRFIGVGRLVKVKCFDLLIKAFLREFKNYRQVKLDIVGGGEEYDRLSRLIKETHSEDQITLLGIMNRQEISEYYKKCNALVMSSNLETFGVPIVEAMASGLPVVTTDAMGFRSLFHKEHGYIVPANNKKALAMAMRKLYDNYESFDRDAISNYAKRVFGEETVYEKLHFIYEKESG